MSGLPPTVAIEQRTTRRRQIDRRDSDRGLPLPPPLFAKTGTQFCPDCDLPVQKQSPAAITKQIETTAKRGPLKVLAPLVKARRFSHRRRALGGAPGIRHSLCGWEARSHPAVSQIRAIQRTHHRRGRRPHRSEANRGDSRVARRALDWPRHGPSARFKESPTVVSTEMSCPNCGRAFEARSRSFSFNSPAWAVRRMRRIR